MKSVNDGKIHAEDLRGKDDKRLYDSGILCEWEQIWEDKLSDIEHSDRNQERWSISKNSYIEGFVLAKERFKKLLEETISQIENISELHAGSPFKRIVVGKLKKLKEGIK